MNFSDLGLSPKVLEAITAAGYTTPTAIQAGAIPHALQRKDVLGLAQTGSGKTAAFVLPMLSMLENGRARARMPRTLILEPTRELAAQVQEAFESLGKNHKLNVALLIGGVSFEPQAAKIDRGADVVIATPGSLLDFFERGRLLMTGIEMLVIDDLTGCSIWALFQILNESANCSHSQDKLFSSLQQCHQRFNASPRSSSTILFALKPRRAVQLRIQLPKCW